MHFPIFYRSSRNNSSGKTRIGTTDAFRRNEPLAEPITKAHLAIFPSLFCHYISACLRKPERHEVFFASNGLRLCGELYLPRVRKKPMPALIFSVGIGIKSETYMPVINAFTSKGNIVFVPYTRGVNGSEGKIEITKGEADDIVAAFNFLKSFSFVDKRRIGFIGVCHGATAMIHAISEISKNNENAPAFAIFISPIQDMVAIRELAEKSPIKAHKILLRYMRIYHKEKLTMDELSARSVKNPVLPANFPVLILHGIDDAFIPADQVTATARILEESNASVKTIFAMGRGVHSCRIYDADGDGVLRRRISDIIGLALLVAHAYRFVDENMQASAEQTPIA
ncbi:MAG: prolyl oligopeptidase family serine peptidase [Candidatus Micrarchaeia archaeon]